MDNKLIETLRAQLVSATLNHMKGELAEKIQKEFDDETSEKIMQILEKYYTELSTIIPKEKVTKTKTADTDSKGPTSGSSKDLPILTDPESGKERMCQGESKEGKACKNKAKHTHEGSNGKEFYCGVHIKKFQKKADANAQPKTGVAPQKASSNFREKVGIAPKASKYNAETFDDVDEVDI